MLLIWKWFPETGWFSAKKNEEMWVFIVARHPTTPPFHASSSPSLSVSCALHAEMISIPAELMRFCWTEKRQGEWVRTKAHTHAQAEASWETHTHTHTLYPLLKPYLSLHPHSHADSDSLRLGHFLASLKKKKNYFPPFAAQVCFLFSSKLQEMLQRWKCWTTITNKAKPNLRFSQIYMPVYPPVQAVQCTRHTHTHKYESGPRAGPSHHGNTLLCVLNSTVIWGCRTSLPPHIDVGAGFPCSASLSALAEATLRRQRREAVSPARGPISRAPARVWLTYRKRRQWKHVKERAVKRM